MQVVKLTNYSRTELFEEFQKGTVYQGWRTMVTMVTMSIVRSGQQRDRELVDYKLNNYPNYTAHKTLIL